MNLKRLADILAKAVTKVSAKRSSIVGSSIVGLFSKPCWTMLDQNIYQVNV
jgi:hypothetical protein